MRILMVILGMLLLTACVRIQATVQSFSDLPNDYPGKTLAVIGYPDELAESLEWKTYKPIFEARFMEKGFVISLPNEADYLAFVTYGIGDPQTSTEIGSVPIYGQTGGGTTYHSGTVSSYGGGYGSYSGTSYTAPMYGVVGSSTYSYDVTTYTRTVFIDLFDAETEQKLYESSAVSSGSCGVISEVIDEITEAIFTKFPSGSGRVTVPAKSDC
ncbi:DUF4136 domain-containing protein [Thalassospira sp. HJ]|uniref:DUF4136 domain-containing protein n=1 Tax=Thalassospira sp. HJ TaxID=1616823 RepID=UPI0006970B6F|nr:DUF4136 domain-containing protein [Thalassospira sp. HJ]